MSTILWNGLESFAWLWDLFRDVIDTTDIEELIGLNKELESLPQTQIFYIFENPFRRP